jgi:DNA-directed RNA polymerase specialized sigma24 family protein
VDGTSDTGGQPVLDALEDIERLPTLTKAVEDAVHVYGLSPEAAGLRFRLTLAGVRTHLDAARASRVRLATAIDGEAIHRGDQVRLIADMAEEGRTIQEVAGRLGWQVSKVRETVTRARAGGHDIPKLAEGPSLVAVRTEDVIRRGMAGEHPADIAAAVGLSAKEVSRKLSAARGKGMAIPKFGWGGR